MSDALLSKYGLKYQDKNKVNNLPCHFTYDCKLCHPICPLTIMHKLSRCYIQELCKARSALSTISLEGVSIEDLEMEITLSIILLCH